MEKMFLVSGCGVDHIPSTNDDLVLLCDVAVFLSADCISVALSTLT